MALSQYTLTADAQAITLLCSRLALPRDAAKPLSASEFSSLAATIHQLPGRPGQLLGLSAEEIRATLGIAQGPAARLYALLSRGGQLAFELERLANRGIWVLTRADDDYPRLLRDRLKRTAPPLLFGAGDRTNLAVRAAAVVGARAADQDSLDFAAALARRLVSDGVAVVSGAARGIDTAAMLAAADAGGSVVGVLADALDRAIRRKDLRSALTEGNLALLSTFHPAARFTVGNAMQRNRYIYCLAEVAFVVASGPTGGTREGALENLKAGWVPLFVRNGTHASPGNADLLRAGGLPVHRDDLLGRGLLDRLPVARGQQLVAELDENLSRAPIRDLEEEASVDAAQPTVPQPSATGPDAFQLVWPAMSGFLRDPHTERELAEHLNLHISQARSWLKRAVDENRVERLKRPVRYRVRRSSSETLFDTA